MVIVPRPRRLEHDHLFTINYYTNAQRSPHRGLARETRQKFMDGQPRPLASPMKASVSLDPLSMMSLGHDETDGQSPSRP